MKRIKIISLLTALWLLSGMQAIAQDCQSDRYQKQVFPNIKVTTNLVYGQAESVNDLFGASDLELNFYEPAPNDEYLDKRPLVVMFFGGAYLLGSKDDADVTAWCDSLAHYGYACATVDYRLDNFANIALTTANTIRAAYRPIQDGRAAIRYMLEDPDNFGFNIDPNYIYTGGESAGGITAIHVAYLDPSERPAATYGNFLQDDLGCLDCSGNSFVQPFSIKGIIDLWGATLDPEYIDADENVPMVIIHGTDDGVVLYDTGQPFTIPFLGFSPILTFPTMYGAVPLEATLTAKGIYNEFYPYEGEGHVFYGLPTGIVTFPNEFWNPVWNQGHNFLYTTMQYDSPIPAGSTAVCIGDTETYTIPTNPSSHFCWEVTGGDILEMNDSLITIQWNTATTGQVMLTEENCIDVIGETTIIDVIVNALPVADFTYTPVTSTDVSFVAPTASNIVGWDWNFGDGMTSTTQNPMHTYPTTGAYIVTLTVTDANGCKSTHTIQECLFAGVTCSDSDPATFDDVYDNTCKCLGTPVAQNDCTDITLNITANPVTDGIYDATQTVTSTGTVVNGSTVSHIAGNEVIMNAGFSVESDVYFVADIIPCPTPLIFPIQGDSISVQK